MAAPVGGQVFSEILPYLEVTQGNTDEVEQIEQVQVPDITEKTISEAQKILKDNSLEMVIENDSEELDKDNIIIKEQIPKAGITVNSASKIYIKY